MLKAGILKLRFSQTQNILIIGVTIPKPPTIGLKSVTNMQTPFVLLGNIVEAYKEQTIKKYKPGLSYQQRLAFLKNAEHVVIETKSVVKLLNASKEEKYYGALKKGRETILMLATICI